MGKQIWFGIPTRNMQWVPAPLAGAESSNVGYVDSMLFENGGAAVERSTGFHKEYSFEFNSPLAGAEGLNVFNKFASGFYGSGLIHFADPYTFATNMLPAHWATPALLGEGWPNFYFNETAVAPTFVDTVANVYGQPSQTMQQIVTGGTSTPANKNYASTIVALPEGYTLRFGWSGTVSGTGRVYYRTINADGTFGAPVAVTGLAADAATRFNASVASTPSVAVQFYLGSSGAGVGQVNVTSMMAQLHKTGSTFTTTGSHVPGEGHTGLMFADEARVETYVFIDPPRKALSTTLIEVGGWMA